MLSHLVRSAYTGSVQFAQSNPSFWNAEGIKSNKTNMTRWFTDTSDISFLNVNYMNQMHK